MASFYPLWFNLARVDILVAGAGQVGRRKIAALLACAPRSLLVVDPGLADRPLEASAEESRLVCRARPFMPEDLDGRQLVFAATGSRKINGQIAELCAGRGILCNVADAPERGNFFVPAHFTRGGVSIALVTGGQSPALARKLREELEAFVGNRYGPLNTLLGRLRPLVLKLGRPTAENSALFRALAHSDLACRLEHGDHEAAAALLRAHLPASLHPYLGELLHGL